MPEIELLYRSRNPSFESQPASGGMVPEMALLFRLSLCRCEMSPTSSGGIVPDSPWPCRITSVPV